MILTLPDAEPARVAVEIAQRLRGAGHEALLVGGCVRSLWLGETPKDYDVATSARPENIRGLFERTIPVGISFGVLIVHQRGVSTEVATFRADGRYLDKRRPESVTFSDARADALRRDFTVNALFLDPLTGEVIDHVGGLGDLKAGLIRTVGDPRARFAEDALRLLRAVRFAARCDFTIEGETWKALRQLTPTIGAISAERIGDEVVKLLTGPHAGNGLRLLEASGLLRAILPEVAAMRGVEQPPEFHPEGDVLTHTALCLDHLPPDPSPAVALGVLLHDIGKPPTFERAPDRIRFSGHDSLGAEMAIRICRRLRLPNTLIERVADLVRQHMRFKDVGNMRPATLKRFLLQRGFDEHLALHRCDALGSMGTEDLVAWCEAKREELRQEGESHLPPPLLTGDDLIALGGVQTEQLEGRLNSPEAARAFVRSQWAAKFPLN
jgi:putative nucleotidyltransferase with HDIG domain